MGCLNYSRITTEPGAHPDDPFCPQASFSVDDDFAYIALLRERITICQYAQRMHGIGRFRAQGETIDIEGPYEAIASRCIQGLADGSVIDTRHDAITDTPFSSDKSVVDGDMDYRQLLRQRWKESVSLQSEYRRYAVAWKEGVLIMILGPYRTEVIEILNRLAEDCQACS